MIKGFGKIIYGLIILTVGIFISIYFVSLAVSTPVIESNPTINQSFYIDYIDKIKTQYASYKGMESHFHTEQIEWIPQIDSQENCLRCHSLFPHKKDRKTRAFNNQHSLVFSCLVCHSNSDSFKWTNVRNGSLNLIQNQPITAEMKLQFVHKVIPYIKGKPLFDFYDNATINSRLDSITSKNHPDFLQIRKEVEKQLVNPAKQCNACHISESNFPWKKLGYSEEKINSMLNNAVVNMVIKYETFYFPN